jgi:hypothetical protein
MRFSKESSSVSKQRGINILSVGVERTHLLDVVVVFCLFVSVGVRGKPRMYCSLLAYCTARFGRSDFSHQIPLRLPTRPAL